MKVRYRKRRLVRRVSTSHELLAKAQQVLGGREEAEDWFYRAAIGLGSRRPVDVAATLEGAAIVRTLLNRMERNVYA